MEPAVQRAELAISKPTTAPNGPFSSQVTGADTIEVKMTVANAQIRDALRKFDLRVDEEEKRYVYFFDTPERDLLEAEIIARARRIVGDRGTTQQSNFGRSIPVPFPGAGENSRASRLRRMLAKRVWTNPCPSPGQLSEVSSGGPSRARGRFDTCSKKSMATS